MTAGTEAAGAATAASAPQAAAVPQRPIRALLPVALTQRRKLAYTLVAGLCYHLASIGAAAAAAWVVGEAAAGTAAEGLVAVLVTLAVLVVIAAATRWWQMWISHDFAYALLATLRERVYDGLARLAPRWLSGRRTGDVAATAMSDVEVTERFYAHTLADAIVGLTTTTCAVVALGLLEWRLGVAMLPFVAAVATLPWWLRRVADRQGRQLRDELADLNADVLDGVQGLRELAIFGQGRRFADRLARKTARVQSAQLAYARRAGVEGALLDAVLAGGLVVVLALAASLVAGGELAAARYPVAVVLAAFALVPLFQVAQTARELGQIRGSARRVFEISDHPAAVQAARLDRHSSAPAVERYDIAFEAVVFRYRHDREAALDGATFHIRHGERVALVGHSGAGKSTCVNLMLRFWDPESGTVSLGGVDLRSWPEHAVRAQVALVPQDVYLFNRSLADNIRLARPEATAAEVEAAARAANIHDFVVTELAHGYDTVCGERGAELSGGQRQRVAIARALIADAPVLVMDEAVSSLDAASERAISDAIATASSGRTTLIVAHRLSTIRDADRIIVLERGRCVETGTHDQLAAADGAYARLIASQRGGIVGA